MYNTYLDDKIFEVHNYHKNMKKIKEPIEKIKKRKNCFISLYDEFIILIRTFQIIGFFPIGKDRSGRLNTNAFSSMAIHCILVFIAISFIAYLTLVDIFHILRNYPMRFDDKILHISIISFMIIHFAPVVIFFERKKIAKYFESWNLFQIEFERITRKPLIIKAKLKLKILIIYFMIMFPTFLYFLYQAAEARFTKFGLSKKWHSHSLMISYTYYGFTFHALTLLWYFSTNALCQAGTLTLNYFEECESKGECSSDMGSLWLRLQDLYCELGKSYSYTLLFFISYLFVAVMLVGYSAMANFLEDSDVLNGIVRFSLFFIGFLSLSIIPSFAHRATEKVIDNILNFVLRWASEEKNLVVARELKWMAESISIKKPSISLAGYVVLSRSLNVSMYGAMVTYFVVVLQFKSSNET